MKIDEIRTIVKEHIHQALQGQSKESLKFEFKFKWPNLKDQKELNEFLKDITAMANTYGPDGFIVYGFDDDAKKFNDVQFTDCGLQDDSQLFDLQSRHLSNNFDLNEYDETIDGHQLSILHFPPTLNKPILIKNFRTFHKDGQQKRSEEHKIFVRNGTTIRTAKKEDLELMYYDRKNIVPEYDFQVNVMYLQPSNFNLDQDISKKLNEFQIEVSFSIENLGLRPICISRINFDFSYESEEYDFKIEFGRHEEEYFNSKIIRSSDIKYFHNVLEFESSFAQNIEHLYSTLNLSQLEMKLFLTNSKILRQEIPFRGFL